MNSFLSVFLGLLATVLLSVGTDALMHGTGVFPPMGQPMSGGLFVLATAYRILYGITGGYLAARIARRSPMKHAVILGAIGSLLSIAGAAATWNAGPEFGPKWYPLLLIFIALPSCWIGGKLHGRNS